jgi:peptide/nickel transport system ATP-binding protein/peptide/nickel transport system permease protein
MKRFLRKPAGVVAAGWLLLVLIAAVFAGQLAPDDPQAQDLANAKSGPSAAHLLGTDQLGRDVLSQLMYGARPALLGVVCAMASWLVLGVTFGLLAGYLRGVADAAISRVTELLLALPGLIILLVVFSIYPNAFAMPMFLLGGIASAGLARVVRAVTIAVREDLYVKAAIVLGLSRWRIMTRHVLPRIASAVIVQAGLFASLALLIESGLAFLGFGVVLPKPSWGGLLGEASTLVLTFPWLMAPVGVALGLTVLAFVLFANSVRDTWTERWAPSQLTGPATSVSSGQLDVEEQPDAVLSVRGLSVEFPGPKPVVSGISFSIGKGETLVVVGETGCGKSVMALAVLGMLPGEARRTSGQVLLGGPGPTGIDLTSVSARDLAAVRGRRIGYVAQDPMVSLDPSFTVGSQLAEAVRSHAASSGGLSRAQARRKAIELLSSVNLPDPDKVAGKYPHQLSGGMLQRCVIALALSGDPELLIADEPTTALDVTVQAEILALLRRLQRERQMAILLITHNWEVVGRIADRTLVMYAGEVAELAPAGALLTGAEHPYARALLASDPVRAVPGQPLPVIAGSVPPPGSWPAGCRFAPRCAEADAKCTAAPVPVVATTAGHLTRCLHVTAGAVR